MLKLWSHSVSVEASGSWLNTHLYFFLLCTLRAHIYLLVYAYKQRHMNWQYFVYKYIVFRNTQNTVNCKSGTYLFEAHSYSIFEAHSYSMIIQYKYLYDYVLYIIIYTFICLKLLMYICTIGQPLYLHRWFKCD